MLADLPSEDRPPDQWRRFAEPGEAEAVLPEPRLDDPVSVGSMFCRALEDHQHYRRALLRLSTPESHAAWGDFSEAARMYADIPEVGFASRANLAVGAPDVAYFKVLGNVDRSYQVLDDQPLGMAAVITLVWRPSGGDGSSMQWGRP
ncbi:hypothetical protein ACQPZJ_10510 [Actinoplanes sp. CA-054009]